MQGSISETNREVDKKLKKNPMIHNLLNPMQRFGNILVIKLALSQMD